MLSDEEKKAIESFKEENNNDLSRFDDFNSYTQFKVKRDKVIVDLIEKQSKEIEELKREKETNHQMIQLAETQILGYGQGYKDGLNKETTATAIVAREIENQIIYEGMKYKINMEWVLKIKAKIEEFKDKCKNCDFRGKICDEFEKNYNCVIGVCLKEFYTLLEKEVEQC
jgi:hypothetical protein